jgi:hypothetical protein
MHTSCWVFGWHAECLLACPELLAEGMRYTAEGAALLCSLFFLLSPRAWAWVTFSVRDARWIGYVSTWADCHRSSAADVLLMLLLLGPGFVFLGFLSPLLDYIHMHIHIHTYQIALYLWFTAPFMFNNNNQSL